MNKQQHPQPEEDCPEELIKYMNDALVLTTYRTAQEAARIAFKMSLRGWKDLLALAGKDLPVQIEEEAALDKFEKCMQFAYYNLISDGDHTQK